MFISEDSVFDIVFCGVLGNEQDLCIKVIWTNKIVKYVCWVFQMGPRPDLAQEIFV